MAPPTSTDAEALAKLQVTPAQEVEWKRLKIDWVNSKKAATKELNKHVITMKIPGYDKDTAGPETQQQMLEQLSQAIKVLNTCRVNLDKSELDIVDFIEDNIPTNDDEEESMNDFTMLALWKAHTEYKNKIVVNTGMGGLI